MLIGRCRSLHLELARLGSLDPAALVLAVLAAVATFWFRIEMLPTLALAGLLGLLWEVLFTT